MLCPLMKVSSGPTVIPLPCRLPYINYISSAETLCRATYDKQDIVRTRTAFAFQSRERQNDQPHLLLCCVSSHL